MATGCCITTINNHNILKLLRETGLLCRLCASLDHFLSESSDSDPVFIIGMSLSELHISKKL